jgi:hypothetical protein
MREITVESTGYKEIPRILTTKHKYEQIYVPEHTSF